MPKTITDHQAEPSNEFFTPDERRAIALYAVADRDFEDFLDMLKDEKTTVACLEVLREMCATPSPDKDEKLDKLMLPFVERALTRKQS